jgi:hypothetical protein
MKLFLNFVEGSGGDYEPPEGAYEFGLRDVRDCLEIVIFNDVELELTETLEGRLFLQGGQIPGVTLRPMLANIEILDDDSE